MYYSNTTYTGLEDIISYSPDYTPENKTNYMIEAVITENIVKPYYGSFDGRDDSYGSDELYVNYVKNSRNITYVFEPEIFLRPTRPITKFINTTEEVKTLVEETFKVVTGKELQNVIIKVCSEEELIRLHGNWHKGILGFSINNGIIANQIFVKNDFLDRLLVTIGHEIGHILTRPLKNKHNEEAKAFAFEFAWIKAIKQNNIGNLANCLRLSIPANNGVHNIAFNFVLDRINNGKDALELHWDLVKGCYCVVGYER